MDLLKGVRVRKNRSKRHGYRRCWRRRTASPPLKMPFSVFNSPKLPLGPGFGTVLLRPVVVSPSSAFPKPGPRNTTVYYLRPLSAAYFTGNLCRSVPSDEVSVALLIDCGKDLKGCIGDGGRAVAVGIFQMNVRSDVGAVFAFTPSYFISLTAKSS